MKFLILISCIVISNLTYAQLDMAKLVEELKLDGIKISFPPTHTFSAIRVLIKRISADSGDIKFLFLPKDKLSYRLASIIFKAPDGKSVVIKKQIMDSIFIDSSTAKLTFFELLSLNRAKMEFFRVEDIQDIVFVLRSRAYAIKVKRKIRKALQDF